MFLHFSLLLFLPHIILGAVTDLLGDSFVSEFMRVAKLLPSGDKFMELCGLLAELEKCEPPPPPSSLVHNATMELSRKLLRNVLEARNRLSRDVFFPLETYFLLPPLYPFDAVDGFGFLLEAYEMQLIDMDFQNVSIELNLVNEHSDALVIPKRYRRFSVYLEAIIKALMMQYQKLLKSSKPSFTYPLSSKSLSKSLSDISSRFGEIASSPKDLLAVRLFLTTMRYEACRQINLDYLDSLKPITQKIQKVNINP